MANDQSNYLWLNDDGAAFGGPGLGPRWTSSRKDAVVTAYAASSRIWYTLSHGTLNELYYPTIDRPQMRDMELLFTDGENFFHEDKRDLSYDFAYSDPEAPAVRCVGQARGGGYTVTKEFITDPHHPVVLMHVKIEGEEAVLKRLKCYALLAPHLDGGGEGNSARAVQVAGQRCLVAWKNGLSLAFAASCGFTSSSCGYVGSSDGYQDISQHLGMKWHFGEALEGNVALTGEVSLARSREFTLAIGLGHGHHSALSAALQTLTTPFEEHRDRFIVQWKRAQSPSELAEAASDGGRLMRISHGIVLTHEDKTYSGAFIASASIPWGASKGDDDLGGYHLVWTRDMVQSATALLACGRVETARRALVYLACTQRPDGGFSQNFWVDGEPYWSGIQLDEVAFPVVLAWRLWKLGGLGQFDVLPFVTNACAFLVRYAPVTQQERWEECAGYSPSTLAVVISALVCAGEIARAHQQEALAKFLEEFADWLEAHLDEWTTTRRGCLLPDVPYHYMRIRPPAAGEPFHNPDIPPGMIHIANREPGERYAFEAREVIDGGFLELVRYGIRRADDPLIVNSLKVVDAVLRIDTPYGPCWRRYNHDGYGQKKDGTDYDGAGQGRAWPILTGERAHYELAAGRDARPCITAMERFSSVGGMLPEQVWDFADLPERGMYFGRSAGSAQPLVWAHAEYLKLLRSVVDGRVFDRIPVVEQRYAAAPGERRVERSDPRMEIWQQSRPIGAVVAGGTVRVLDAKPFRLVYTTDEWATRHEVETVSVATPGSFADMVTHDGDEAAERPRLLFTLYWPEEDRWLGRNCEVLITREMPSQGTAADKPMV